jgi:hypothetical protein
MNWFNVKEIRVRESLPPGQILLLLGKLIAIYLILASLICLLGRLSGRHERRKQNQSPSREE